MDKRKYLEASIIKLFLFVMVLSIFCNMCSVSRAEEQEILKEDAWEYKVLDDGTAEIIGHKSKKVETVTIPTQLGGKTVSSLGEDSLSSISFMKHVVIPDSVTTIKDHAFSFNGLEDITIPDSVVYIGANPFFGCSDLTEIIVSRDHPYLATIDGVLFSKPDKRLVCYPGGYRNSSYEIPQGIKIIGSGALYYCEELTKIVIPDSVVTIEEQAFYSCNGISSLVIPNGVESIKAGAFEGCDELDSVTLPDSIINMGDNPFRNCSKNPSIIVSPDHPYLELKEDALFSRPDKRLISYLETINVNSYTIPEGVQIIGGSAFQSARKLVTVEIPESVISIGPEAFAYGSLTEITLPSNLVSLGSEAFAYCEFTSISIPDTVLIDGNNPFRGCSKLTEIIVSPDHPYLEVIDGVLFNKQEKRLICYPCGFTAESYVVPDGTEIISDLSVSYCSNLKTITIPESVQFIGRYTFMPTNNISAIVTRDSYAQKFCEEHKIDYTYVDANDWLND